MAKNVVNIWLHVRGAGDTFEEANTRALRRLDGANRKVQAGEDPNNDPGVDFRRNDPGDGPCTGKLAQEFFTSSAGLPDPVSDDDD